MTSFPTIRHLLFMSFAIGLDIRTSDADSSYEHIGKLASETIHSPRNHRELRPLQNQSDTILVNVSFSLVSIVDLDDVAQKLVVSGFFSFDWRDEIFRWNASDYGGVDALLTESQNVWRPRLMLVNTAGNMEPLVDQSSTAFLSHEGAVSWVPGGVFTTFCQLNLDKYPFDEQECNLRFCTVGEFVSFLKFVIPSPEIDRTFFIPNRGWDLVNATTYVDEVKIPSGPGTFSCPTLKFKIARRPTFFVLYVIIPVILLSFLNALVFAIPADSGEKISYGITVLLALYVFISTISALLPQASDTVPIVTIYLFSLLACSVLSVVGSIVTVIIHEKTETIESQERKQKTPRVNGFTSRETGSLCRQQSLNCVGDVRNSCLDSSSNRGILKPGSRDHIQSRLTTRRFWGCLNKYANAFSLFVFILTWLLSTMSFFSYVMD